MQLETEADLLVAIEPIVLFLFLFLLHFHFICNQWRLTPGLPTSEEEEALAALIYFVNWFDGIPDFVKKVGFKDDEEIVDRVLERVAMNRRA